VEGLATTGLAVRTASDTWTTRAVTGTANEITVTNGDGVSGAPTLSLPTALTFTGKTVTGGTFSGIASASTATTQSARDNSTKIATTAYVDAATREKLTAARTYYVRTDGSDSNTGLANSAGSAWLTLQKAVDVISGTLDLATYDVTVNVADGTYTGTIQIKTLVTGGGQVKFVGNTTTRANCNLTSSGSTINNNDAPINGVYNFDGFTIASTGGTGIVLQGTCLVNMYAVDIGACNNRGTEVSWGAQLIFNSNFSITGNTPNWILRATVNGFIFIAGRTITHSGTRTYTSGFAESTEGGIIHAYSVTIVGTFTGKNYNIDNGGGMTLGGGGTSYFGGSVAGTIGSTGWKT
jgi:hypothetical protein